MAKTGRPSKFTQAVADEICRRIALGESSRGICSEAGMPALSTLFLWLRDRPEFSDQYARAREEQADFHVDEMIEIADTTDDPQKARLQIDARKWKASKLAPKKYGDVVTNKHTGPEGGAVEIVWKGE